MQQGRGELTPAAITRAVQNLADNPLAARMHGSKLLSATQVADTSVMSQLNYALERQKQLCQPNSCNASLLVGDE